MRFTLEKVNGDWILKYGDDFSLSSASLNITQLNPTRSMWGINTDDIVAMVKYQLDNTDDENIYFREDFQIYNTRCEFWMGFPATEDNRIDIVRDIDFIKYDIEQIELNIERNKQNIAPLVSRIFRYALLKMPTWQQLEKAIIAEHHDEFNLFGKNYHNCTREFLVTEFLKSKKSLLETILKIYITDYGLQLTDGGVYPEFQADSELMVKWEIVPIDTRIYYHRRYIEPDPAIESSWLDQFNGEAQFGSDHICW